MNILGKINGEKFIKYIKVHKLETLKSSVARDKRQDAGFTNGKRAFTNISESWNAQIKSELECDRNMSIYRITEGIVKHLSRQCFEVVSAYMGVGNIRQLKKGVTSAVCEQMSNKVKVSINN